MIQGVSTLALGFCVAVTAVADACTGITLTAEDGSVIHARTGEFGTPLDVRILIMPSGITQTGGQVTASKPASWTAKYGFVGVNAHGAPAALDGINEAGLAAGAFYFPDYADYATVSSADDGTVVSPLLFVNWVLTNFATIEEVRAALPGIKVSGAPLADWGGIVAPFHWIVQDPSGESIVIEPVDGQLKVYDDPLGVITNAPTFDWHLTNLRNFIYLSPLNVPPVTLDGLELKQLGQGSGLAGLPGDFTPPSRFVRAVVFSQTAFPSATGPEAVEEAFHILNQFDIPRGAVVGVDDGKPQADITQATVAADTRARKFYMHTFKSRQIQMIDLSKIDFETIGVVQIDPPSTERIEDVTPVN
ncbi:linear amide C-N hydrolase [Tropicimonas sp. IMCC6043]|uniref:linear amide C-N hydrolase n=1 Tax=Tropicimonas sp. IMCC6043 TaxID=2510645 RepID=UPI0013EB5129|nr:choloylglycine hydrolase family protein [Tropicimonas sp. IMCC6043]